MRPAIRLSASGLLVLVGACGDGGGDPAREAAAREEARVQAVEEVKANQSPPPEQLALEPIAFPDIEQADAFGAGCNFVGPGTGDDRPLLALGGAEQGFLKIDGEMVKMAADKGSRELPYLGRSRYDGRAYSFALTPRIAEGARSGEETTDYPGTLVVNDARGRPVFTATGTVQCGA